MGLINEQTPQKGLAIGRIDIMDRFALFEADARYEKELLKGFGRQVDFEGVPVRVERVRPDDFPKERSRKPRRGGAGGFPKKQKKFKKGKKRVR